MPGNPEEPAMPAPTHLPQTSRDLTDAEFAELDELLERTPEPLTPCDGVMLDGYLCGVLLQPRPVPAARWLPHVTDVDGRPLSPAFDPGALHALVRRRHEELDHAITRRAWFDPWVFELAEQNETQAGHEDDEADPAASEPVYPWVAGFATALELFPDLMAQDDAALTEPLALMYRHLDPDDLEDADALLEVIESFEPPADLAESVEGLVRATLLLADISRPQRGPHPARRRPGTPPRPGGRKPAARR